MCDVIFVAEETEHIGRISSCWLEMKMSWSQMKEVLLECNETKAADIAELMKQYILVGGISGFRYTNVLLQIVNFRVHALKVI